MISYRSAAHLPWSVWPVPERRARHRSSTCTTEHYTAGNGLAQTSTEQTQGLVVCLLILVLYYESDGLVFLVHYCISYLGDLFLLQ